MKKLFSFVVFLFVFALFQISPSQGQNQEPKELTEARNSYNVELQKAIKPVNDRYLPKLEELKKQLTFKGDIKGAVAVEEVITKMSGGQPLEQESDNDPQELKEIKNNYMVELETAVKPVKSLYLAKLEVLKQQLALSGALKAALAVEEEMGKFSTSSLSENIPAGAVKWKNHWYKVFDEKVVWLKAKSICQNIGGHLVIIENMEKNDFLTELSDGRPFLWIGASDKPKTGHWSWIDGKPMIFQN